MFVDGQDIDFYAESILIEYMGLLQAGTQSQAGSFKSRLTFHLWGEEDAPGIQCQSKLGPKRSALRHSGLSLDQQQADVVAHEHADARAARSSQERGVRSERQGKVWTFLPEGDCFYQYEIFDSADKAAGRAAYFGHKVLAVSFLAAR